MTDRTTVRLEPGLLRAAKKKAAEDGRTLTSLIEEGLRGVVSKSSPVSKKRETKFSLPVSKATGGVRPGVDLSRTSELLELLDEDLPFEKRR
jgi:hypothetical protein